MHIAGQEDSATSIAKRVESEQRARDDLQKGRYVLAEALFNTAWLVVMIIAANQFDSPLLVKIVLFGGVSVIPSQAFELFYTRRRLNAALALLGMAASKR